MSCRFVLGGERLAEGVVDSVSWVCGKVVFFLGIGRFMELQELQYISLSFSSSSTSLLDQLVTSAIFPRENKTGRPVALN